MSTTQAEFAAATAPKLPSSQIGQADQAKSKETPWRIRVRYIIWKICTFFITLVVLLVGFASEGPAKVWSVALINLGITTALYFVYRYGWTKIKWGVQSK
jgi:hypothetical protein